MCAKKYRDIVKIECLLLLITCIICSLGSCQNAFGRKNFETRDDLNFDEEADNLWNASPEGGRTLDEEKALMDEEVAVDTEPVPQGNDQENGGFYPASDFSTVSSITKWKDDNERGHKNKRLNKSTKDVSADIRGREMKSTCVQIKKEPDSDYDLTENEIKRLRGQDERLRKYRGQNRRKRKYLNKNSNRERRIRKNKRERSGRRRKVRRRKNDNTVRLFFAGLKTNETNVTLEPFSNLTTNRDMNDQDARNKSEQTLENPTLTTSISPSQLTTESKAPFPPEPTKRYHYAGFKDGTVEKEFSKYLEREISKSILENLPYIESYSEEKPTRKTGYPDPLENEIKTLNEQRQVEARYRVPKPSGYESPRFDLQSMLGYSRTEEDLPILEMEKEVLQRTMEDYNAYMSSNLLAGKLTGARKQPIKSDGNESKRKESEEEEKDILPKVMDDEEIRGDLSCVNGTFLPAPLVSNALIKYVKSSIPGQEYLEADYECAPGFYMVPKNNRLLCKNRRWVGQLPKCKFRPKIDELCAQSHCEQICKVIDGQEECFCREGFKPEGTKCKDINECEEDNGNCEFKCVNTVGSYRCECPEGMTQGEDKYTCADINECVSNEGHGPCQDTCHNHVGGYECSCEGLPGTILSPDNHTCHEEGPCSINNAGCSHTCLSTMGRVFCLCPDGFMLEDDWKTCQDVNECAVPDLQTEVCHYGCINTPGSYRCAESLELKDQRISGNLPNSCLPGYELSNDGSCLDINECAKGNGGCNEVCENTAGSFFCACDGDERVLSSDGKSCTDMNSFACPPLNPAGHGYLMCSRSMIPTPWMDRRKTTNQPGTKCFLKCPLGYQLHGEYELTCLSNGTWDGPKHGECVRYSKPRLDCPPDVKAELSPGRDEAFVTFDQPSTDLDWFRYVRSKPTWGTRLEANLKLGVHEVTFYARHPVSKKQTTCNLRITVTNGEAPKVKNCPSDIEITGQNGSAITWVEPTFTDNVKIMKIQSNESPGRSFTIGGHKIEYEASDEAGWTTKCIFTVVLRQA
ncbi:uncharacterized protein LOC117181711 [Belonocnema kinseyi]|uniref:uncharacterized protein LOC117181711 n=1 Tax=Belonocnema kinseyi TaxID=2817044 RepID=UPI00143D761F|nr:uncharacterized protein LOC117181711 [Belonocnema kinseyi]